jgi:DUF4097 and DUF4098 domain-containing protein YvlB
VALLSIGATAPRAEGLDSRIPVQPGGLLQIDLDLGEEGRADRVSLDVRSHEADEVYATADLSGLGASSVTFRVEPDDNGVRLYGRSGGLMSWLFGGPGVVVRVWVPRSFSIDARSSSGPIRIEDVVGKIRVRTTEASIEVRGIEGSVSARTDSGDVSVIEVQGEVSVRASEGSIELSWISGTSRVLTGEGDITARHVDGAMDLRTDSGEISLRDVRGDTHARTEVGAVYASFAAAPEGVLETQRGSVEVVFPSHAGTALEARSGHGSVVILDGIDANGQRGEDFFVGEVNGGGPSLHIYTARGNVRVGQR